MSRIGKEPITIPSSVELKVADDGTVSVKGSNGELSWRLPPEISIRQEDGQTKQDDQAGQDNNPDGKIVHLERINDQSKSKALHGLSRTLVNNMVVGVSDGFVKELEIVGVGYRAQAQGDKKLELQLGFSHPVTVDAPAGITFEVPSPVMIKVKGADKQAVGEVAASIRSLRKPEPYKGKGIRYVGEHIIRKAGKTAK